MDRNHEIYKHKHICLLVDHYNSLGIVRSLGEEGINPIVVLCEHNGHIVDSSKYVKEIYYFDTFQQGLDFIVENYSNEELKPFIYNGNDNITVLLDNNYDRLKDHFYFTNGQGGIEKYLQKFDITQLAEKCGLNIPKEELLKVGKLPKSLKYPLFTKATTSATGGDWKAQAFICENEEELKDAYSKIDAEEVLVQEFIRKKNELCIDGISINGGEQVFMPYACHYYRFPKKSFGHYMYFFQFVDKELIDKITEVIRGSKFTGIFCIEFLVGHDGKEYFLEVNFRNSGWSYAFTKGGFNLLVRWAKATLDNTIDLSDFDPKEGTYSAMVEHYDLKDSVFKDKMISLRQWYKEMKNCDCLFLYQKEDKKPAFWAWWELICSFVSKRL